MKFYILLCLSLLFNGARSAEALIAPKDFKSIDLMYLQNHQSPTLIVIDLDHSIFYTGSSLSPDSLRVLKSWLESKYEVIFLTSNPYIFAEKDVVFKQFNKVAAIIGFDYSKYPNCEIISTQGKDKQEWFEENASKFAKFSKIICIDGDSDDEQLQITSQIPPSFCIEGRQCHFIVIPKSPKISSDQTHSPQQVIDQRMKGVVARIDILEELRRKKNPVKLPSSVMPKTATDSYLQWELQHDYSSGDNQDVTNIYKLLQKHSNTAYAKCYIQKFNPLEMPNDPQEVGFRQSVVEAIKKEREMNSWFVFYHGLTADKSFAYDVFTAFRSFLGLKRYDGNIHSLRAFHKFFEGFKNVNEFVDSKAALHDHAESFREAYIATNITLLSNIDTHGECTFDYYARGYSNQSLSKNILREFLNAFGILDTKKYDDLREKYFPKKQDQGSLLQIFVNPDVVNELVYLSGPFGIPVANNWPEQKENFETKKFLENFRSDPSLVSSLFLSVSSTLNPATVQARLFLKPELMMDSSKVQIRRYSKSLIQDAYFQELRALVEQDVLQWISKHLIINEDTKEDKNPFLPPLQTLYKFMHDEQVGQQTYQPQSLQYFFEEALQKDDLNSIPSIFDRKTNKFLIDLMTHCSKKDGTRIIDLLINTRNISAELQKMNILKIIDNDEQIKSLPIEGFIPIMIVKGNLSELNSTVAERANELYIIGNISGNFECHDESFTTKLRRIYIRGTIEGTVSLYHQTCLGDLIIDEKAQVKKINLLKDNSLTYIMLDGTSNETGELVCESKLQFLRVGKNMKFSSISTVASTENLEQIEIYGEVEKVKLANAGYLKKFLIGEDAKIKNLKLPAVVSSKQGILIDLREPVTVPH